MDQGEDMAAMALAAMLFAPAAGAQDKIVWDIAIYGPPREVTAPIEFLAKYLDEKTAGKFTFKLHYSESIAPAKSVLDCDQDRGHPRRIGGVRLYARQGAAASGARPAVSADRQSRSVAGRAGGVLRLGAGEEGAGALQRHRRLCGPLAAVRVHGDRQGAQGARGLEGHARARAGSARRRHADPGRGADIGAGAGGLHRRWNATLSRRRRSRSPIPSPRTSSTKCRSGTRWACSSAW